MSTRRACSLLLLAMLLSAAIGISVAGEEAQDPLVIVFYEEGCPNCEAVDELLAGLIVDLPPQSVERHEITDLAAFDLLTALAATHDVEVETVPVVFVGDEIILGADRAAEFALRAAIGDCATIGCASPLERVRPPEFPWADALALAGIAALLAFLLFLQPI